MKLFKNLFRNNKEEHNVEIGGQEIEIGAPVCTTILMLTFS
jgi:hypothetical protein